MHTTVFNPGIVKKPYLNVNKLLREPVRDWAKYTESIYLGSCWSEEGS